jgi:hypothetical protein
MSHFTQQNQEVHNYMTQDVPHSLKSNSSAQAIKTRNRIFQVSSTSQSQNSGGVVLFNIPPSNYSITRGTMALRCRVSAVGLTGAASGAAATSIGFQGPGAVSSTSFVPMYGNGYQMINRLTLYGANSAVIEQQNYCNDNMNLMLIHNSNGSYLGADGLMMAGVGQAWTYSGSTGAEIDLVLPLPLSVFNSSTQDFPNYLLSAPLTLQIDLASLARTLYKGASITALTDYQITNTYLIYQAVELPAAYVEAERMAVKSSPFIMNLTSTLNVQVPASILTSYSLGLNASSVRAVFVLPSNGAGYSSTTQLQYARDTVDYNATFPFSGAGTNAIVFVDGNQINSAIFDTPVMCFQGLKNALHHSLQGSVIYSSPALASSTLANNPYVAQFYAVGWDLTSYDEEATLFGGTPCTTLNVQLTGYGAQNPTYLNTLIVVYDVLLAFEADGTIQVKR